MIFLFVGVFSFAEQLGFADDLSGVAGRQEKFAGFPGVSDTPSVENALEDSRVIILERGIDLRAGVTFHDTESLEKHRDDDAPTDDGVVLHGGGLDLRDEFLVLTLELLDEFFVGFNFRGSRKVGRFLLLSCRRRFLSCCFFLVCFFGGHFCFVLSENS